MLKNFPYILLGISLIVLGASIGFFLGKNYTQSPAANMEAESAPTPLPKAPDSFYTAQTATVRGKITKIEDRNITVENLITKETATLRAAGSVAITKAGASPSTNLATAELNKEVLLSLLMNNGNYEVIGIQYPIAPASLPPIAQ